MSIQSEREAGVLLRVLLRTKFVGGNPRNYRRGLQRRHLSEETRLAIGEPTRPARNQEQWRPAAAQKHTELSNQSSDDVVTSSCRRIVTHALCKEAISLIT